MEADIGIEQRLLRCGDAIDGQWRLEGRATLDQTEQAPSNPGFSLMLILLALAVFVLSLGYVTPVPERARRRTERRRR